MTLTPQQLAELLAALKFTLGWEGDFSNDPGDPGGNTRFGITEAVARGFGYMGPMYLLPKETAIEIYSAQYWTPLGLNYIHDPMLQKRLFDFGVNCGVVTAAMKLQKALNRLNSRATLWADVVADGHLGGKTLWALNACLASPKMRAYLLLALDVERMDYYLEGLANDPTSENPNADMNEKFVLGWINRTDALLLESAQLVGNIAA